MALQVFIDDSGKDDPPVFVLAGFIAPAERWAAFTDEWKRACEEWPSIDYFKMKEANRLSGCFNGWTELQRDIKLARLAKITNDYLPGQIASVTWHDLYKAHYKGFLSPHTDSPYIMMLYGVVMAAHRWTRERNLIEPIEFIFDEQLDKQDVVFEHYTKMMSNAGDKLSEIIKGTPVFKNDKEFPALQAADLLAWHIRRSFVDKERGQTTHTTARTFLMQPERIEAKIWDESTLARSIEIMAEEMRDREVISPHFATGLAENWDSVVTRYNDSVLHAEKASPSMNPIGLFSIPDKRMKRFELVHSCQNDCNPHLHRKASGACLSED